ncbi:hypothetical protein [Zobellia roscoffensis]|uniref:hypothetical protein n=1 Tax=Zobellia roscoffensis TaxID=2779508 RepID=UPI001889DAD9|nr:hypothetical protein [Zobellia roscoffensis]
MKFPLNYFFIFLFCSHFASCQDKAQGFLPSLDFSLKKANVRSIENRLIVSTGNVERTWQLTKSGFITTAFKNIDTDETYSAPSVGVKCDWAYYGLINGDTRGNLISLTAKRSDDKKFTSEHIEIVAEFKYPKIESSVKYVIWAYPDAPGIRTQLFIKGDAKKYMDESDLRPKNNFSYDLVNGTSNFDYFSGETAERYIATTAQNENSVQYHVKGLDPEKQYKLGFTWWDFKGEGLVQNVRVTSVDGEINEKVIKEAKLPDYKNEKRRYEARQIDLPSTILHDGTFRVFFDKVKGKRAQVSEVFIYEKGNRKVKISSNMVNRLEELRTEAPNGYSLIGYIDCGEAIQAEKMVATGRVDFLPVSNKNKTTTHIGYYNDTQHRNKTETPLIKIETSRVEETQKVQWSNMVRVDEEGSGIIVVKESHKCVNQYGVDTGEFVIGENGIENTGTSLFSSELNSEEYKWCWPSWSIAYSGGEYGSELALKKFDRIRYPIDEDRDIYIQANTWGSGRGKTASQEENILLELESQADLGIDIQQIDDGWQNKDWGLRKDWYPKGWQNVVNKSKETGVKLGLWAAAMPVTYEALKNSYDQANFVTYKLDFASLGTHENMEKLMGKIRKFILYTNQQVRVNWDLTENAPRFGYFWAKEYGSVYLENRKPDKPENVVYIPHLVLRDIWHLTSYTNINKFQTSIQNTGMTNKKVSDAYLHTDPYAVAIGLVGTPLFFQETQNYEQNSREEIKALLKVYKKHRKEMYDSYVFSIGNEPNNKSWSGFQWYKENRKSGYLLLFRELENNDSETELKLRFLKNKNVMFTNLEGGESKSVYIKEDGLARFKIDNPASYKFIKYAYE